MSRPAPKNSIINEIESALRGGTGKARINVLMRVTDLFVGGATKYTENETKLFDDVMGHLISNIEDGALVELSTRLASIANAPNSTVQSLARNDTVEISGPILTDSAQLSDGDLIEIAKTKSQAHLAKIAGRSHINERVTEALVDHGNADVANMVTTNSGARFSRLTLEKLVMRADGDERLAGSIFSRSDIAAPMFRRLLLQATDAMRLKLLEAAKPEQKESIKQVLDQISAQVGKGVGTPRNYAEAKVAVAAISQDTDLTRNKILEFADSNKTAEMIAALSALSGVPVDQIDRLFYASNCFGLIVLCKSITLEWITVCSVLAARSLMPDSPAFDDLQEQYSELSVQAALQLMHFWQGRQRVARNFLQATDV
ncbi:MAG TPA: DUF2336 domain-containing protein [Pseudolabrys sp.]|nr:DUF2336 domain-containing protein [Pseudolabrys sp.]